MSKVRLHHPRSVLSRTLAFGAAACIVAVPTIARAEPESNSANIPEAPTSVSGVANAATSATTSPVQSSGSQTALDRAASTINSRGNNIRISNDARIDFGEFKISRARFVDTRSLKSGLASSATNVEPITGVQTVDTHSTSNSDTKYPAIAVPSNTLPSAESRASGESLQQRSDRIASDRRLAEATAREADANAEYARQEALDRADHSWYGPTIYGGYSGYRVYGGRPNYRPDQQRGLHASRPNRPSPVVTTERFASDDALWRFSDAATPQIGRTIDQLQHYQLKFSRDAYPSEIVRIQNRVDGAQRGNRLLRVRVPQHK